MIKRIGIIVGRFQVSKLHAGHKHLISEALKNFDEVHIFLGCTKGNYIDKRNPLPPAARATMILEEFPQLYEKIHEIEDVGNWPVWVKNLDSLLELLDQENTKISIVGSRDSVAEKYESFGGKYSSTYISEIPELSGTKSREEISNSFMPVWDMRERNLAIWLTSNMTNND